LASSPVVLGFDPGDDREAEFFADLPASGVEHVLLQQAEEGHHGGVVAGRADAAHGADEIVVVEQSADLLGTELAAAVRVQNRPCRAPERDGVADRGRGQFIRQDPPDSCRLDACRYGHMMAAMARAATTSDVFNAIAEPQRREILVLLRAGERPVTELARELGMTQPGASKHLRVLREVGLVRDRKAGKQRLYGLDARGLRPVHEWTGGFERFWNESFDRLDAYVQDLKQARQEE
jgi:DNA-binding transcriptional ArsR family regulator